MTEEFKKQDDNTEEIKSPEDIENQIEQLLNELVDYALEMFPEGETREYIADEWYFAEMQAEAGKDREKALKDLQIFVEKLRTTPKIGG